MKPRRQSEALRVAPKAPSGARSPHEGAFPPAAQVASQAARNASPALVEPGFRPEPADADESGPRRRDRWYTTGEMARLSSNTLRTVRFYEEAGILQPVGRTEGGHRLFARAELDRLMLVTDMREAGLSLEEIRNLLETKRLVDSGPDGARRAIDTLRRYMEELQRKVDVLTRLHGDLSETVETADRSIDCEIHGAPLRAGSAFATPAARASAGRCPLCDAISNDRPLPRAMRVLWALGGDGTARQPREVPAGGRPKAGSHGEAGTKLTSRSGVVAKAVDAPNPKPAHRPSSPPPSSGPSSSGPSSSSQGRPTPSSRRRG